MAQDIADASYLFPWYVGRQGHQIIRQMPRRFGYDFQGSLHSEFEQRVLFEISQALPERVRFDAVDGFKHFCKNRSGFAWRHQKIRTAERSMSVRS